MGIAADYFGMRNKSRQQLQKDLPEVMDTVVSMVQETYKDGTLSKQFKELMALAIGIYARCEPCMIHHTNAALEAGATREQVMETLEVAIQMGGGPSVAYGYKLVEILEEVASMH
jgi:AhpD family alkylhydroperoxidase